MNPDNSYSETEVHLEGRSLTAPSLYIASNHPLVPRTNGPSRTFIYFMDTTEKGMIDAYKAEAQLKVQYKPADELLEMGFLELLPGDFVFAACTRTNKTLRRPHLDVPKIWVTGEEVLDDAIKDEMVAARERAMGSRQERSTDKPSYDADTNTFAGGCAIERDKRNLIRTPDTRQLETSSRNHIFGPPCFTTMQYNLSGPQEPNAVGELRQMGKFGQAHLDIHDYDGAFADMTYCSDIPADYEEGFMFISFPDVFTRLAKYRGAKFSGLTIHGGTPPTGDMLINWPLRCVPVFYEQGLAGQAKFPSAAGPSESPESDQRND